MKVVGLRASDNNRASTVLKLFADAILQHGVPSRVRGDRGGENFEVAIFMIRRRSDNRASFIWGTYVPFYEVFSVTNMLVKYRSTRNTRIERLWVEIGTQFARRWRVFFLRLERLHHLDADNPHHIWLLHRLFLPAINKDCEAFQASWNYHQVSGPDTNEQTPFVSHCINI